MPDWTNRQPDPLGNTRTHFAVAGLALAGLVVGLAAVSGWDAGHTQTADQGPRPTIVCEVKSTR